VTDKRNIYQRIAAVTAEVKAFEKDGNNTHHHFRYASIEQIIQTIQPICIANGICLIQEATTDGTVHAFQGASGINNISTCVVTTHAINMDDPTDWVTTTMPGQGYDSLDKGIFKAISGGRKYGIFCMFNLHSGDEEPDAGTGPAPQTHTAQPRPQAARPAKDRPQPTGPPTESAARLRAILMPELPEWPPQGEYQGTPYDIKLNEKYLSDDPSKAMIGGVKGAAGGAGYGSDEHRHKLFEAIYIMFGVPKALRITSTKQMSKAHAMLLMNVMKHGYFVGKAADDPLPWAGAKAPEPDASDTVDPSFEDELEEDEAFYHD